MDEENDLPQQAARIRRKLAAARKADPELRVFGASRHKYHLGPPISPARLAALEAAYSIELPAEIRAFFTLVGNGSGADTAGTQSGAGPHYGIYEAEQILQSANMAGPPLFSPNTTAEEWDALQAQVDAEVIPFEDLTRGCAYIASQGCSLVNLLVLTGPETGRVVNFDEDTHLPQFAFEANFLDWYERWLDEILAGYLLSTGPYTFGTIMGGDDVALLAAYDAAQSAADKLAAITGFFKLVRITPDSANRLVTIAKTETGELRQRTIEALLAYAPKAAQPFLNSLIADKHSDIRSLCYYLGENTPEFVGAVKAPLLSQLAARPEAGSFLSILTLLMSHKLLEPEAICPFLSHKDPAFRAYAVFFLGRSANPSAYAREFAAAMRDDDLRVVRNALQAIKGMNDPRLRAELPNIRARFKEETVADQTYILSNLARVEKQMFGLSARIKRLFRR